MSATSALIANHNGHRHLLATKLFRSRIVCEADEEEDDIDNVANATVRVGGGSIVHRAFTEPLLLHKRTISLGSRTDISDKRSTRRARSNSANRRDGRKTSRSNSQRRCKDASSHVAISFETSTSTSVHFANMRGNRVRQRIDEEDTVKCIFSSLLFLTVVLTLILVAVVKNPQM